MFRSLFGGKKKRTETPSNDDTIRSAKVGDVVVISGFSTTFEDAYFIVENVHRYGSSVGEWHELIGVDGDRRVGIEWSYDGEFFISVSEQDRPKGLVNGAQDNDNRAQIVSGHREGEGDVVLRVELLSDAVRRDNSLNGSGYSQDNDCKAYVY